MYDCEDLTPVEHDELALLTQRRNRRNDTVTVTGHSVVVLDALAEMGFLRRQEEGWVLLLQPCRGHGVSPGHLRARALRSITAQPFTDVNAKSLSGQQIDTRGSITSINDAIRLFDKQCRTHCWSSALNMQGRAGLGRSLKTWIIDGATFAEIEWMIHQFFADIKGRHKHGNLWKMFLARKATLYMAYERQHKYDEVEAHRHDTGYWVR